MMFPVPKLDREPMSPNEIPSIKERAQTVRELTHKHRVLFVQDGHTTGTVQFAHENLEVLGPDALLSHSTDLTAKEISICKSTDTKIVHNPSARASIAGRCPVPELIDAGVTVMLGSDGTAPDRSYDMFRHMFHCMHYQRTYYHDATYMPPGKVLEMATIDGARALGLDKELGSLEPGKKADIILVDVFKPHIYPFNMPVERITYYANGNDVDTVIVNGEVLMENRVVKTVDEAEVLEKAQHETEAMLDRTGLRHLLEPPEKFWGHTKY
jgi:cytosine/adenosine deaminase-related metal-dependent hydrolase